MQERKTKDGGTNLLGMVLVLLAFAGLTVYATIALASQDWFWFLSGFHVKPDRVIVYHDGQKVELAQGDPGYEELATAVRDSLDGGVARQSGMGMGEKTLEDAYNKNVTVEAFFIVPVKLHAWFNTYTPNQMLFPITGRHSETSVVFFGLNGYYLTNGPILKDMSPLRTAMRELGYIEEQQVDE